MEGSLESVAIQLSQLTNVPVTFLETPCTMRRRHAVTVIPSQSVIRRTPLTISGLRRFGDGASWAPLGQLGSWYSRREKKFRCYCFADD